MKTLILFCGFTFFLTAFAAVPNSAEKIQPLQVGGSVPDVSVKTMENKTLSLLKAVKKQPTVLVFYRGGWCPYCNVHLGNLKKVEKDLLALGYQILAISPDQPSKLKESVKKNQLTYQLLSDSEMRASKAFGLAFKVDKATREKYKGYGIDLVKASGQSHFLLPVPAVYLLDTDGKILFTYVNSNYKERLPNDVLMAAARSFKKDKSN